MQRVGGVAEAGAVQVAVEPAQTHAIDDQVGGQPGQPRELEVGACAEEADQRDREFQSAGQQQRVEEGNTQERVREAQNLGAAGGVEEMGEGGGEEQRAG